MRSAELNIVHSQPSWAFKSDRVSAFLTRLGGHLGPVNFKLGTRLINPFSVAPWASENPKTIPLLQALRGDFFCCPFGGNETPWRGERHSVHGESANSRWKLRSIQRDGDSVHLHATLKTNVRGGQIDKHITLVDGQTVIYQRHVISGMSGPMPVGHHPMLRFPDRPGSGLLSVSRFVRGQVYPGAFEKPENGGYQSLKPSAMFRSLERVPQLAGGFADLSRYPARRGYEDLVMLSADPKLPFAWSAIAFPKQGYVWFSLRNQRVLRGTVLWFSNGGRHSAPWSGRHVNVMGIEDTTSHFHDGLAKSACPNALTRRGIPTAIQLSGKEPTAIAHIMAIATIPPGFDHVADIRADGAGVELRSRSGKRVRCAVKLDSLHD